MNYSKICIIIPAYNEEASIKNTILAIRKLSKRLKIVVVNDGSDDRTSEIARITNCTVIDLPFNLGIGAAVQTGIVYAKNKHFKTAIQIDADGQHDPKDVPKLIKLLNKFNIVIGSRFIKKVDNSVPKIRRFLIRAYSFMLYLMLGKRLSDPTSGFKAFDKKAISFISNYGFGETSDLIWLPVLIKNGFKIKEASVKMKPRNSGRSSFGFMRIVYHFLAIPIYLISNPDKISKNESN
ncbi:MAG TPA: glycosyltransferase family 2 protein [Ignavibacteriaceae bacterium]